MCDDITDRALEEAYYIALTGATVRSTAKIFHFSKSTVHKDVTQRLINIDRELYARVKIALEKNNNLFVEYHQNIKNVKKIC